MTIINTACPASNVTDFLLEGKNHERPALLQVDRQYDYGELQAAVGVIASYVRDKGGKKGDRVILISENSFFWVAAYLGILRAGLVCVPLPPNLLPRDLDYIRGITESRLAMAQAGFAVKMGTHLHGTHLLTDREIAPLPALLSQANFYELNSELLSAQFPSDNIRPDDLAALMFTSGSTGRPRGVMVSHRNIMANTRSIIQYLGLTESDRIMTVLPFHYCFGASLLHTHLRVGGSLVIDLRFMYPSTVLEHMLDTECTGFAGVPSHFQILLRSSALRTKVFPHLRYVQQAGGHLAPVFIRKLREALPGTQIFIMYGQTEATARLSYLPPEFLDEKLGSVGKGIPGVKLLVVDESGQRVQPGDIGEIVAGGENVTLGYWREPEETATTFRDGKLHTGDLATIDEDGFIYIVDRAKDFLKCGGKRISCQQVENQLQEFECLLEAVVVGMPDEVLGEAVKAFLVTRMPGCPAFADCFRTFCKEHVLPQLVPREFVVMPALPKNSAGKVLKHSLRGA
jgi:acyl-CoA synthetase (AMP-forming)/AMP-acid ligase II